MVSSTGGIGTKGFEIFVIVPSVMKQKEYVALNKENVSICVSTESKAMGIYKSFNYGIFERRHSVVIAFDGNSAGENLIQEAHNGKSKAWIFVYEKARSVCRNAEFLNGYVSYFDERHPLDEMWKMIDFKDK